MYVKSVHFKNVKGFADQKFEFGHSGKYAGWHVFVGGNASGKSTVLKGLALALAGPQSGLLLMGSTAGWIRQGELHGSVSVEIERDKDVDKFGKGTRSNATELKAAVEWNKPSHEATEVFGQVESKQNGHSLATRGVWDVNAPGWFCAGYGPMRRLTGSSSEALSYAQRDGVVSQMLTLFREDAALSESEVWLKDTQLKLVNSTQQSQKYLKHYKVAVRKAQDVIEHSLMKEVAKALEKTNDSKQQIATKALKKKATNLSFDVTRLLELVEIAERELEIAEKEGKRLDTELGEASRNPLLSGAIEFLNDGLLSHGLRITRISDDQVILVDSTERALPIRDLSDGNRAVYALVLDLLRHFSAVYGTDGLFEQTPEGRWQINKPGVVLIDEADSHLHPTWQQTLPEWLKAHFPQVQFIVSTHSPLILQAADPGGVYVLPLQNEIGRKARRLNEQEYEKLKWGRAEKILLGAAFGLQHSRSRWATDQVERWKLLNAKQKAGAKLTTAEKREYQRLKKQMEAVFDPVYELESK